MPADTEKTQSEEGTPTAEQKALQEAKALQDAKNALLISQKTGVTLEREIATAGVPDSKATALEGDTNLEDAGYLAELVAYQAMRRAAGEAGAEIGKRLKGRNAKVEETHILLVDTLDLTGQHALLQLTMMQLQRTSAALQAQTTANEELMKATAPKQETGRVTPAGEGQEEAALFVPAAMALVGPALAALPAVLGNVATAVTALGSVAGAAAGVAAWFRSNYDIKGQAIAIKQSTAKTLLAGAVPDYAVYVAGFHSEDESALLDALGALITERLTLINSAVDVSMRAEAVQDEKMKAALQSAEKTSTALAANADKFIESLAAVPADDAQPMLARALVAEQVCAKRYTHHLYVQLETSGGQTITEKSLWNSGRLTYVGGGALSYVLAESTGRIVAADSVPVFSEMAMRKGKEPTELRDVPLPDLARRA